MAQEFAVRRPNERVVAVLKHLYGKAIYDTIDCGLKVVQYGVSAPPPHKAYGDWVYPRHDEVHRPFCTEGLGDDVYR